MTDEQRLAEIRESTDRYARMFGPPNSTAQFLLAQLDTERERSRILVGGLNKINDQGLYCCDVEGDGYECQSVLLAREALAAAEKVGG